MSRFAGALSDDNSMQMPSGSRPAGEGDGPTVICSQLSLIPPRAHHQLRDAIHSPLALKRYSWSGIIQIWIESLDTVRTVTCIHTRRHGRDRYMYGEDCLISANYKRIRPGILSLHGTYIRVDGVCNSKVRQTPHLHITIS